MVQTATKANMSVDTQVVYGLNILKACQSGRLEELRKLSRNVLSDLYSVPVSSQASPGSGNSVERYTPMHYGVCNKQWVCVAYLINLGVPFNIKPEKQHGPGKTVVELLSGKEFGLFSVLQELVNLGDRINFDYWFNLITDQNLVTRRKQEVIENRSLRESLSQRLPVGSAHLMMACLLTGSHVWQGMNSDYMKWTLSPGKTIFPFSETLNCMELIFYSGYLANRWDKRYYSSIVFNLHTSILQQKGSQRETPELEEQLRVFGTTSINKCLGFSEQENEYYEKHSYNKNLKDSVIHDKSISFFFMQGPKKAIEHVGILYQGSSGDRLIHIHSPSITVCCDSAEDKFSEYFTVFGVKKIFYAPQVSE